MTTDDKALVYELRKFQPYTTMCNEAADRIEALTAENERLRALLYPDEMTQEDYEAIYGWGGQG